MDQVAIDQFVDLISKVGFPIGVATALLVNALFTQKKLSMQMQKLTASVETLTKQLAEVVIKLTQNRKE